MLIEPTSYVSVTNCEGTEILPSLQSSKLACFSFMDADRRCGTPRLETKDSLLLRAIAAAS